MASEANFAHAFHLLEHAQRCVGSDERKTGSLRGTDCEIMFSAQFYRGAAVVSDGEGRSLWSMMKVAMMKVVDVDAGCLRCARLFPSRRKVLHWHMADDPFPSWAALHSRHSVTPSSAVLESGRRVAQGYCLSNTFKA